MNCVFVCLFVCLFELWLSILIDSCGYVGTLVIFQSEFCYPNVGFLTHRQNNQPSKPKMLICMDGLPFSGQA